MDYLPNEIFEQYKKGMEFKASIGSKGIYEQSRLNERFYIGDQWHGAKCGNDRPLVRHNVIKRIGDYKISQILSDNPSVRFSAEGIPTANDIGNSNNDIQSFSGEITDTEINYIMDAFGNYHKVTAERLKFAEVCEKILRNAYICGTAVLYTYWDNGIYTGLFADYDKQIRINGDISCEVLSIDDVVFGDPYLQDVQKQGYIILSSKKEVEEVLREARLSGADTSILKGIAEEAIDGKITQFTKLYKEYKNSYEYTIKCIKTTEKYIIKNSFDTGLKLYPISIFTWERKTDCIYGESEVTYLIPNQIAINRMITANVWSAMTTGMPIMVVNGDTVTDKITNDPGQIIKVFGSNEDVAGAVKYINPPVFTKDFDASINTLIDNTLTQSGANEVALGDSKADNATALIAMRDAALMPLKIVKSRYYTFIEETARIWADFWVAYYGNRSLKQASKAGVKYIPFDAKRYKALVLCANVEVGENVSFTDREKADTLLSLYDKGIINREQLLMRFPDGLVKDIGALIKDGEGGEENEGI